jgi:hypothetical protein
MQIEFYSKCTGNPVSHSYIYYLQDGEVYSEIPYLEADLCDIEGLDTFLKHHPELTWRVIA